MSQPNKSIPWHLMEPEHRQERLLLKVAYSPIFGCPEFGQAIDEGISDIEFVDWYEKTFSLFERYR